MFGKLQSLCSHCHEAHKKYTQHRGFERPTIGEDGWPIDPNKQIENENGDGDDDIEIVG